MKTRAMLCFSKFSMDDLKDQLVEQLGAKILNNMTDDNPLAQQTVAAICLGKTVGYDVTYNLYKDGIENILKAILDIMDQYFNPELVETLKALVKEYDDEVAPYAVGLCEKLGESYITIMGSLDLESDDHDSKLIN